MPAPYVRHFCAWHRHIYLHISIIFKLHRKFVHPLLTIYTNRRKGPDALCKQHVVDSKVSAQIALLHGASHLCLHFYIRDHPTTHSSSLLGI